MRGKLLAKHFPDVGVLRSGVGEDGVDDSGRLMSDSDCTGGALRARCQVNGFLFLGASLHGRRLYRHRQFL
jgi:hypothetical protein